MAYLVLTEKLRERLLAAGAARVINTASAHIRALLGILTICNPRKASERLRRTVALSLNILFTRELARRLRGTGVTANCLHPGFVATRFGDQSAGLISYFTWCAKFFALSPVKGAETIVYLASSPEVAATTGNTFTSAAGPRPRCRRGTTDWL